ncbi:MAG: hypothetical protein IH591_05325 [Bacteroidales bacterium]|nr:hypothetical protein [Bacteroidales bacterium]
MSIFTFYSDGFRKSVRSMRTIVLLWVVSLAGSLLVVAPFERNIGKLLDGSIGPELMYDGFNIDIFADIMHAVLPAMASFSISFFLVTAIIFVVNTFITAGLFRILAGNWKKPYKRNTFLKGADRGFGGFLFVAIATVLIIIILFLLIFVLPMVIAGLAGAGYSLMVVFGVVLATIMVAVIPLVLLIADYARVLLTNDKYLGPFRAMIDALRLIRKGLFRNWLIMLIILASSAVIGFISVRIVTYSTLRSGMGLFLLLILSQLFVFLRTWIKVIRYGTVTSLYESGKKK